MDCSHNRRLSSKNGHFIIWLLTCEYAADSNSNVMLLKWANITIKSILRKQFGTWCTEMLGFMQRIIMHSAN